ncbi:RNA-directed DNA polymerase, eukaryota [Tanacetum coccineum]
MGSYRTKEDDVAKISTSVFITNFPESFSAKELFHSCKQYGHVVDSFIPTKRSKSGKRFGFVRFISVFNEERLVNNLCTVWIDRYKLHANIARFHRPPVNGRNHLPKDAGRVKSIPGLISDVQTAFLPNRQILDGPFIINELLSWCKHKKQQAMVFKVDFAKAYDSISPTSEFQFHCGLKQGDPLAPYLFILIMESLHLSLSRAIEAGIFKGIKIGSSLNISHLFYADDAVFIGEWSIANLSGITHILHCFSLLSGLSINLKKSHLLGVGIRSEDVNAAALYFGCSTMKTPFKYLGVMVGGDQNDNDSKDGGSNVHEMGSCGGDVIVMWRRFRILYLRRMGRVAETTMLNDCNMEETNVIFSGNRSTMNSKDDGADSVLGQVMGYNMDGCLAQKAKKDWVKELCVRNKVNFLALQETKIENMDLICVKMCWGNLAFDYVHSDSVGNSGGILYVWDLNSFCKSNATISDYFVMVRGVWRLTGQDLLMIAVYAPHDFKDKQLL